MIDFRAFAKLAGLDNETIEKLVKEFKLEDTDAAYERGKQEALNKINTLVEITLLAVKDNPTLKEIANTIKRWMKEGIDLNIPEQKVHSFIQLDEYHWYNPEKNIMVVKQTVGGFYVYLPHHDRCSYNLNPSANLEDILIKLS